MEKETEKIQQQQEEEKEEEIDLSGNEIKSEENGIINESTSSSGPTAHSFELTPNLHENLISGIKDDVEAEKKLKNKRLKVLIVNTLIGFLGPVSFTCMSPAIPVIMASLDTTHTILYLAVSLFYITCGLVLLFWGPASDTFGRKPVILISTIIFTGFNLGCALSPNVYFLIGFRIASAVGAGAAMTVGAGSIADSHPIEIRAKAMGIFLLGPLIGPVVGAMISGVITTETNWRNVFYFLTAFGAFSFFVALIFLPETLEKNPNEKKPFPKPWAAFYFLKNPEIFSAVVTSAVTYASFVIFSATFSVLVSQRYHLSSMKIGFSLIVSGVGSLLGSLIGGKISEIISKNKTVHHRLISVLFGSFVFVPILVVFGWTFEINLAFPLVFSFFIGFCFTFVRPGLTVFAIEIGGEMRSGQIASTVSALLFFFMFIISGLATQFALTGIDTVGVGWFFTIIAAATFLVGIPLTLVMHFGLKTHKQMRQVEELDSIMHIFPDDTQIPV